MNQQPHSHTKYLIKTCAWTLLVSLLALAGLATPAAATESFTVNLFTGVNLTSGMTEVDLRAHLDAHFSSLRRD